MGQWGFGSDENDTTYDELSFGMAERVRGFHPLGLDDTSKQELLHRLYSECGETWSVGMVIWCLKMGMGLRKVTLIGALENLIVELADGNFNFSGKHSDRDLWVRREAYTRLEIRMIETALKSPNGWTDDKLVQGTRGITSEERVGIILGPQIVRRNAEGSLESLES